ncbi:Aste57867_25264 [Aphanomyces stellatus]|uniref:Aste57867_25264 protein n=1 Tax=Aphanomyces stellatus TaxID=120398 RepID=A0A485LTL6_9STRA|nr:hypothetical protein As57867_025186 [Aphanomyces stellatus]VFU01890.1 Aste57867_25264 [Aphanomyces stellatus]
MDPRPIWLARLKETFDDSLKSLTLTVHPSRAGLRGGGNPYTIYQYTITKPGLRWVVDRRYSECHRLHKQLVRSFRRTNSVLAGFLAPVAHIDFPKKRFVEDTRCIVGERKFKLQLFLRACLQVRLALLAYTAVYYPNDGRQTNRLLDIVDHIDAFLAMPLQHREDDRRLTVSLLSLLQQRRSFGVIPSSQVYLDDCAICLCECDATDVITLPCTHAFHSDCVIPWIARDHSCPLCRTSAVTS